ncbi:MAG: LapA family protein [Gammaproteobacteria bacterium]
MRVLSLLIFFVVFIVALVFSVLNYHSVEIHLYVTTIKMPLIVALTIDFILGILVGATVVFINIVKLKAQYAKLNKMLDKSEK